MAMVYQKGRVFEKGKKDQEMVWPVPRLRPLNSRTRAVLALVIAMVIAMVVVVVIVSRRRSGSCGHHARDNDNDNDDEQQGCGLHLRQSR